MLLACVKWQTEVDFDMRCQPRMLEVHQIIYDFTFAVGSTGAGKSVSHGGRGSGGGGSTGGRCAAVGAERRGCSRERCAATAEKQHCGAMAWPRRRKGALPQLNGLNSRRWTGLVFVTVAVVVAFDSLSLNLHVDGSLA